MLISKTCHIELIPNFDPENRHVCHIYFTRVIVRVISDYLARSALAKVLQVPEEVHCPL